jgi:hypothetical protein
MLLTESTRQTSLAGNKKRANETLEALNGVRKQLTEARETSHKLSVELRE